MTTLNISTFFISKSPRILTQNFGFILGRLGFVELPYIYGREQNINDTPMPSIYTGCYFNEIVRIIFSSRTCTIFA